MSYPRLIRRLKALWIDGLIIIPFIVLGFVLVSILKTKNDLINILIVLFPIFMYEPFMVSLRGATFGHSLYGLKIITTKGNKLNIVLSTLRFLLKIVAGSFSLIFVLTTKKHQALHDLLSGSLVVNEPEFDLPSYEKKQERFSNIEKYKYPSKFRRIFVILSYMFAFFVLMGVWASIFISTACIESRVCSTWESTLQILQGFVFWGAIFYFIVVGWRARLPGCRRQKIV
ncbi:RDD family protein [Parendozoicomonas sp. Alg238-R29]|uniref:RDD family protein n=1 Tax=Parendozoicomonas sp. Alg238-R29 TaxID=2993446 RepID=UPI00248E6BCE|nr:RDD family protein [Parendozoicomonas sp. Alg238-R29]